MAADDGPRGASVARDVDGILLRVGGAMGPKGDPYEAVRDDMPLLGELVATRKKLSVSQYVRR